MKTLQTVHRKLFEQKLAWSRIDKQKALAQPEQLELLREACLVESYLPVYTGKMMGLFWDDLDATTIFTIESIEAYGHYYVLRRYLETIGYKPVSDEEVLELRERERSVVYTDQVRELVNFMGTEHFAAQFFMDMSQLLDEPVVTPRKKSSTRSLPSICCRRACGKIRAPRGRSSSTRATSNMLAPTSARTFPRPKGTMCGASSPSTRSSRSSSVNR